MPLLADIAFRISGNPVSFGEFLLWLTGSLALWLVLRLIEDRLDRSRIAGHVAQEGGTIIRIEWNPFERGWFGDRRNRIYQVTYRTRKGKTVTATCKTSMFSGVYWTGKPAPSVETET